MNEIKNSNFSSQNFNLLEIKDKKEIYQKANESQNVDLVRHLNSLEMKPEVPNFSGPTIISSFMDIATKYDAILKFLKDLRKTNRLLTEREFQPLSTKKWFKKSSLTRLLGCDHLMKKIRENQLTYMKTPLKIAVIEDVEALEVKGWAYSDNIYEIYSDQVKIYAEEIKSIERKLSREEIDELIKVIAAANFIDLWPENIVVAEDGVYFIDTEFKSFAGSICWEKMGRFEPLINEEDKVYFKKKIQEKMDKPKTIKEKNDYDFLKSILNIFNELTPALIEKNKDKIEEIKNKIQSLEYVGAKEVGSNWTRPNEFTFNLKDIIK